MCLGLGSHHSRVQFCVCPSLGSHHLYFVRFTKKTTFAIAYALCTSFLCSFLRRWRQCHHHQPTFSVSLLCAPFQEDDINVAITNLCSLRLCYVHLSKKTTSTLLNSLKQSTISYLRPKEWTKNFLTYCVCMWLDSILQLIMKVPFVLCAYLLAFFPKVFIKSWFA